MGVQIPPWKLEPLKGVLPFKKRCGILAFGKRVTHTETTEPVVIAFEGQTRAGSENHVLHGVHNGRHMSNTIERSVLDLSLIHISEPTRPY